MRNNTCVALLLALIFHTNAQGQDEQTRPLNVLLIISDDLTATALSCYGNQVCQTPNIDRLAAEGMRFNHAYCQGTYCGPSRASFMSGYYPHATGILGYTSPRNRIGNRDTWAGHFRRHGYYTSRVSKIFHMGVPGGIEAGGDGADDPISWTERFNSQGPEWRASGLGETLEGNPNGTEPVKGGNTFVVVQADGDEAIHSDSKTTEQACELIRSHADEPFFLGVGFVRPHVPFVAPARFFEPFPFEEMELPEKRQGDWEDIPDAGINYKTSRNMRMNVEQQQKAVAGYYASVAYIDEQVGKVLDSLEEAGIADQTIVIFTSDHGYHLGEHDFWAKVSLHEESALVPLIIRAPDVAPGECHALVELIDLFPTTAALCELDIPDRIQGEDLSPILLDDPTLEVRDAAFVVNGKGFLLRTHQWAFIQYSEDGSGGIELYDMQADREQFTNLANHPDYATVVESFQQQLAGKLADIRDNDLE